MSKHTDTQFEMCATTEYCKDTCDRVFELEAINAELLAACEEALKHPIDTELRVIMKEVVAKARGQS